MRTILIGLILISASLNTNAAPVCQDVTGALIYDSSTTLGKSTVIINPRMKTGLGEAHVFIGSTADIVSLNVIREGLCQALKFGIAISELRYASKGDPIVTFNANGKFTGLQQVPSDDTFQYVQSITCVKN